MAVLLNMVIAVEYKTVAVNQSDGKQIAMVKLSGAECYVV